MSSNLDSLTLGEIKTLKYLFSSGSSTEHPYVVGEKYAVRTVTMIYVGKLEAVYQHELVFSDCAWVADTGRFYNFLKDGTASEIEPMPYGAIVGRGAIVDASVWKHELLKVQK